MALQTCYDLIVLDVMLPGIDGFQIIASSLTNKEFALLQLFLHREGDALSWHRLLRKPGT